MTDPICGIGHVKCSWNGQCTGCAGTDSCPFGGACAALLCGREAALREFKEKLSAAFRAISLENLAGLSDRNAMRGAFTDLKFTLLGGQKVNSGMTTGSIWETRSAGRRAADATALRPTSMIR